MEHIHRVAFDYWKEFVKWHLTVCNIMQSGFSLGSAQNKHQKNNMFCCDSGLLSASRWLLSALWLSSVSRCNWKQSWEQSNYPLLSPGCRNEGLTHLDCLKGFIAVRAGDTFSPIVTFPLVSLNLAEPPTTCCHSSFSAGPMCQWSVKVNSQFISNELVLTLKCTKGIQTIRMQFSDTDRLFVVRNISLITVH